MVWTVGYVLASIAGHHLLAKARRPGAGCWHQRRYQLADYAATLGHAGIATLATASGRFAEAHAIVHRYFGPHVLLAMKWQRRPINTSKPCSLRAMAAHGV